jgi:hypothetical protein
MRSQYEQRVPVVVEYVMQDQSSGSAKPKLHCGPISAGARLFQGECQELKFKAASGEILPNVRI